MAWHVYNTNHWRKRTQGRETGAVWELLENIFVARNRDLQFFGFVATFIASWMRKKIEEMARINLLMCFHLCVCV